MKTILSALAVTASLIAPIAANAAVSAPAGATKEQSDMVLDWAKYATACRGGAVDKSQETGWGYCGIADFLLFKLASEGVCLDEDPNDPMTKGRFSACKKGSIPDPLKDYPF